MKSRPKKKSIKRNFNIAIFLFLFFLLVVLADQFVQGKKQVLTFVNTSSEVEVYAPIIHKELKEVSLEEYTVVLAAIMQQESNGRGGDPMQSSESLGLAPNSITDPQKSIEQGVKHFQRALEYGSQKQVDFETVIQAYNMGIGYIDFVSTNGGRHSEELAKKFSYIQVQKNPTIYDCQGDKSNFRYPYCYGDFTYSTKVTKNIEAFTAGNQLKLDI